MVSGDSDIWHFIFDDDDGSWSWLRLSPAGEQVAQSPYSFQSFNVCVADAELAGFVKNPAALRRVRASELSRDGRSRGAHNGSNSGLRGLERRRRPRPASTQENERR